MLRRSGARKRLQELDGDAHSRARRAPHFARRLVFRISGSRDVEVSPRWTMYELLEKQCRGGRPGPAPARILHVRPIAADEVLVIVPFGQPPEAFTDAFSTLNQLPSQL